MKYLLTALAIIALFASCGGGESSSSANDLKTYAGLSKAVEDNADVIIYDVRTAGEYEAGHIPGSINIPYDVITEQITEKDKDAAIVLYCRSGNRSGRAYAGLKNIGYTNLVDFGGISNWKGELVTGSSPN